MDSAVSAGSSLWKHWLPAGVAALAVVAVITTIVALSDGTAPGSSAGPGNGSSLSALAGDLLAGDATSPDIQRTLQSATSSAWAVECGNRVAPESARLEFAGAVERGPEYERSVQAATYADAAAATAAADALMEQIESCAAETGAALDTGSADLGASAQVRSVVEDSGSTSTYVVRVAGTLVVLGADHAVRAPGSGALDAAPTTDAVRHALDVLCTAGVAGCA
jgi:hypothetical protein